MLKGRVTDVDAAILGFHLPIKLIWPTLSCLHHWGAPTEFLQVCIRCFWKTEKYHQAILNSAGFTSESARQIFRRAVFLPPPGLSPTIQVWRGTAGRTQEDACKGLCWTLDRDVACWFATLRNKGNTGAPLVMTAHVQMNQILFCDNERDGLYEREVVLESIARAEIDGIESEWKVCGERYGKKRAALQERETT